MHVVFARWLLTTKPITEKDLHPDARLLPYHSRFWRSPFRNYRQATRPSDNREQSCLTSRDAFIQPGYPLGQRSTPPDKSPASLFGLHLSVLTAGLWTGEFLPESSYGYAMILLVSQAQCSRTGWRKPLPRRVERAKLRHRRFSECFRPI